jgi:hypothetical protein
MGADNMTQVTASETAAGAKDMLAAGIGHDPVQKFCQDAILLDRLQVTAQELEALSQASLLGSISSKQDVLFMLRTIRGCLTPDSIEDKTAAIYFEMSEEIRRSALAKLADTQTRRSPARWRRWPSGLRTELLPAVWRLMELCFAGQPWRLLRKCRESTAFGVIVSGGEKLQSAIFLYLHELRGKVRALQNWQAVGESIGRANGDDCDVHAVCAGSAEIAGRVTAAPASGGHSRGRVHRRHLSRYRI